LQKRVAKLRSKIGRVNDPLVLFLKKSFKVKSFHRLLVSAKTKRFLMSSLADLKMAKKVAKNY
jgi:hypothetical protein